MRFKTFVIFLLVVVLVGCTQQAPEKNLFGEQMVRETLNGHCDKI